MKSKKEKKKPELIIDTNTVYLIALIMEREKCQRVSISEDEDDLIKITPVRSKKYKKKKEK